MPTNLGNLKEFSVLKMWPPWYTADNTVLKASGSCAAERSNKVNYV